MKINRLLEITIIIMNRGTVTAKELAERFEVSTRTIYRDVEALSSAGVPVYMSKGRGGGISILDGYSLSNTLLSGEESESLMLAVQAMGVARYPETDKVLEKLGTVFKNTANTDWIEIDFAGWGSSPNEKDKLQIIRRAVINKTVIEFDYINSRGIKLRRRVEPEKLYFSVNTWYLIGYCLAKNSPRVFRFSRIKNVADSGKKFAPRPKVEDPAQRVAAFSKPYVKMKLLFTEEALYRLYDEFDESCITKTENGYEVNVSFPEDEWVYGFLLSFGPYVQVLSPARIRNIVIAKMQETINLYKKNEKNFKYDTQMSHRGGIVETSNNLEVPTMEITKTTKPAQPALYVRLRTNLDNLTDAFNEVYGKIGAYLAELGEAPAGAPYAAYYNDNMNDLDVEMGFPVSKNLPEKGDVKFREIPAIENALTAVHKGPYSTLNDTYAKVYKHIAENGLAMAGPQFDFYVNDPSVTPAEELVTEIVIPISAEPMVFCQSCGMPMGSEELFGTEKGGGKSEDYCVYCYKDGAFTADVSMDEMIDISFKYMAEQMKDTPGFNADEAMENMKSFFPMLKRWKG